MQDNLIIVYYLYLFAQIHAELLALRVQSMMSQVTLIKMKPKHFIFKFCSVVTPNIYSSATYLICIIYLIIVNRIKQNTAKKKRFTSSISKK